MNLFQSALAGSNFNRPPIWFMRQAGRYHAHYQALRKRYDFMSLCKDSDLACEVTLGPMQSFNFDAAILFSDLLFPLEAMGMGLKYQPGPILEGLLKNKEDVKKLDSSQIQRLEFQREAIIKIRAQLPNEKGLIGFVGAPLTLYTYALENSHESRMESAKKGFSSGLFDAFEEKLRPLLLANMCMQADSGIDALAVFDSSAGAFDQVPQEVLERMHSLFVDFKKACHKTALIYYAKGVSFPYWKRLEKLGLPIQVLGIDWKTPIEKVLSDPPGAWGIQGNIDPHWLRDLSTLELEAALAPVLEKLKTLRPELKKAYIAGLGHGVLPKTPEVNVHALIRCLKENV